MKKRILSAAVLCALLLTGCGSDKADVAFEANGVTTTAVTTITNT